MAALITAQQLQLFAPRCKADEIAPHLDAAARKFGIDTLREIRHWMATLHHESAGFTVMSENLNYSAERLMQVWPKRFPTLASAQPYARNPRALANKVYGGRGGNVGPDDGWRYRGGGWTQLTFLDNYKKGAKWSGLDIVSNPDLIRTYEGAALTAAGFWFANGLNDIVAPDPGEHIWSTIAQTISENEEDDLRDARQRVNGGQLGLVDVRLQVTRAAQIWGL